MDRNVITRAPAGAGAVLTTVLLLGVTVFAPRAQAAEATSKDLAECIDSEWADYNECLMNSASSWGKKMCDLYFEAGFVLCGAKFYGEVRNALEKGF